MKYVVTIVATIICKKVLYQAGVLPLTRAMLINDIQVLYKFIVIFGRILKTFACSAVF